MNARERRPLDLGGGQIPAHWHSSNIDRMVADWQTVARGLARIGPPVAYVGFSMGTIFGIPTVAAIPSIQVADNVDGENHPYPTWERDPAHGFVSPSIRLKDGTE